MAKVAKRWSLSVLLEMLKRDNWIGGAKQLRQVSASEWNRIGDWLFYALNPSETNNQPNRKMPDSLGTLFRRAAKVDYSKWLHDVETFEESSNGERQDLRNENPFLSD